MVSNISIPIAPSQWDLRLEAKTVAFMLRLKKKKKEKKNYKDAVRSDSQ